MSAPTDLRASTSICVRGATKSFAGRTVLRSVDLDVRPGSIHALVGANGSGKSTLIKALAGVQRCDPGGGRLQVGSMSVELDAHDAQRAESMGIVTVHQQPAVFPHLTVAENLAHGARFSTARGGCVSWSSVNRFARAALDEFEVPVRIDVLVRELRPALRTMVAVVRALSSTDQPPSLLILDEPTANLPPREAAVLQEHLRRRAAAGQAILYVSHRLDEVAELCDACTVLRDGEVVAGSHDEPLDATVLARRMFGEAPVKERVVASRSTKPRAVLELVAVHSGAIDGVSLSVAAGEVLGVVGLPDAGVQDLLRLVSGEQKLDAGAMSVSGSPVRFRDIGHARAAGVVSLCGDLTATVFPDQPIEFHLAAGHPSRYRRRGVAFDRRRCRADAEAAISRHQVVCTGPGALMSTLSGGNQQKVVIAGVLAAGPTVLVVDDPTAGVDMSARTAIYRQLRAELERGLGVLLASSDVDELATLCDRVIVVRAGRFVRELARPDSAEILAALYSGEVAS